MFVADSRIVDGQCGIGTWSNIQQVSDNTPNYVDVHGKENTHYVSIDDGRGWKCTRMKLISKLHKGGCGFSGTGFIPTELSKETYEYMCKTFRLVFQTPVRINKNSGNPFFYAMFDDNFDEANCTQIATIEPKWPFKEIE